MSTSPPLAVRVRGLEKHYGSQAAVRGLDLDVPAGCFYGLLGRNGAGKTTTVHCLTGLARATRGSIELLGLDASRHATALKARMGVVPERLNLFDRLTLSEFLYFTGRLHGFSAADVRGRADELAAALDLEGTGDTLLAHFSKGMQRKAALAAALIHGPELLFLDEPFDGIDVASSRTITTLLEGLVADGVTVFLTSHIMDLVARLCRHVAIVDAGALRVQGELAALLAPLREAAPGDPPSRLLERLFVSAVHGAEPPAPRLAWYRRAP